MKWSVELYRDTYVDRTFCSLLGAGALDEAIRGGLVDSMRRKQYKFTRNERKVVSRS